MTVKDPVSMRTVQIIGAVVIVLFVLSYAIPIAFVLMEGPTP